jgi:hypothetical protein
MRRNNKDLKRLVVGAERDSSTNADPHLEIVWKHILAPQTWHVRARPTTSAADWYKPSDPHRHGREATDSCQTRLGHSVEIPNTLCDHGFNMHDMGGIVLLPEVPVA